MICRAIILTQTKQFVISLQEIFVIKLYNNDVKSFSYKDILSYNRREDINGRFTDNLDKNSSIVDALHVLQFNTEYPISSLDGQSLDDKVIENYVREILDSSEISIKYRGYIQREQQMADKIMRLENLTIPEDFDFDRVESLSIECRQKLKKYSPRTIAQASRISGVSPADISVLLVYFGR